MLNTVLAIYCIWSQHCIHQGCLYSPCGIKRGNRRRSFYASHVRQLWGTECIFKPALSDRLSQSTSRTQQSLVFLCPLVLIQTMTTKLMKDGSILFIDKLNPTVAGCFCLMDKKMGTCFKSYASGFLFFFSKHSLIKICKIQNGFTGVEPLKQNYVYVGMFVIKDLKLNT